MPYIPPHDRVRFDNAIDDLAYELGLSEDDAVEGQMNYIITRLSMHILKSRGLRYRWLNGLLGVMECVKQELYRRVGAGYEDGKQESNGDVFDFMDI